MGSKLRMQVNTPTYAKMLELRKTRKEFVGDDDGTFYRNQKLLALIRTGEITSDNIDEYMNAEKMSENSVPVDWYHLQCYPHPQDIHDDKLIGFLQTTEHKRNMRCRVTKTRLKRILYQILLKRIDKYLYPENYMNNKILCIVGESGTGKTLASLHLQNKLGANVICSFTTRPPRDTEIEGREHHFINIVPDPNELLAYTIYNGYEYYALKTQVFGNCTVYVIDEIGLQRLKEEHGEEYQIYTMYITRAKPKRRDSGVDTTRIRRDERRMALPLESYDWIVENNSTKKSFFEKIEYIYNEIKNK